MRAHIFTTTVFTLGAAFAFGTPSGDGGRCGSDRCHQPRRTAVLSDKAATAPTQRNCHLQCIAETRRRAWQKASGYNKRAKSRRRSGDGNR